MGSRRSVREERRVNWSFYSWSFVWGFLYRLLGGGLSSCPRTLIFVSCLIILSVVSSLVICNIKNKWFFVIKPCGHTTQPIRAILVPTESSQHADYCRLHISLDSSP